MARQAERREATARAVLEAATRRFGEAGFEAVTVDEIAAAAGVAKGAVYHYFPSKEALFEAVLERTSAELAERIRGRMRARDGLAAIAEGARLYFEGCADPPTGRILLKDGPAVLGWERWREIDARHFLAMLPVVLGRAVSEGVIARQPVEPLARMLVGALTEAAVASAVSDDPAAASRGYVNALERLSERPVVVEAALHNLDTFRRGERGWPSHKCANHCMGCDKGIHRCASDLARCSGDQYHGCNSTSCFA